MVPSWIRFHCATTGSPKMSFISVSYLGVKDRMGLGLMDGWIERDRERQSKTERGREEGVLANSLQIILIPYIPF